MQSSKWRNRYHGNKRTPFPLPPPKKNTQKISFNACTRWPLFFIAGKKWLGWDKTLCMQRLKKNNNNTERIRRHLRNREILRCLWIKECLLLSSYWRFILYHNFAVTWNSWVDFIPPEFVESVDTGLSLLKWVQYKEISPKMIKKTNHCSAVFVSCLTCPRPDNEKKSALL